MYAFNSKCKWVLSEDPQAHRLYIFRAKPLSSDPSLGLCLMCLTQRHAAALCVPGGPGVSRTSVSVPSARTSPCRQCAAVTASPTTASVFSVWARAYRRGGLKWPNQAAVMKVGKWLWNRVIMLTNRPLKWCNYLYQLTCATELSQLWIFITPVYATSIC